MLHYYLSLVTLLLRFPAVLRWPAIVLNTRGISHDFAYNACKQKTMQISMDLVPSSSWRSHALDCLPYVS